MLKKYRHICTFEIAKNILYLAIFTRKSCAKIRMTSRIFVCLSLLWAKWILVDLTRVRKNGYDSKMAENCKIMFLTYFPRFPVVLVCREQCSKSNLLL